MPDFSWYHAFSWITTPDGKKKFDYEILRRNIEEFGVNTQDRNKYYVIEYVTLHGVRPIFRKVVDLIFEYKPDIFRTKHLGNWNNITSNYMTLNGCYVFQKALEQDTEFECLRYPLNIFGYRYENVGYYVISDGENYFFDNCNPIIRLLLNHYQKGTTFFEMMKIRLIK